jgi:hypothetical protein
MSVIQDDTSSDFDRSFINDSEETTMNPIKINASNVEKTILKPKGGTIG